METKIDEIIKLACQSKHKCISFRETAKKTGISLQIIEQIARLFEKNKIVETIYPLNPFAQIKFKIIKELPDVADQSFQMGKLIEKYTINDETNHMAGEVYIIENIDEKRNTYFLKKPTLSNYTKLYLNYLKDRIALELPPETVHMSDEERKKTVYVQQCIITEKHLSAVETDIQKVRYMCGIIKSSMFGFGDIDTLLSDDWLEEIAINKSKFPILVYHRKYGWLKTNIMLETEEQIMNYSSQVARRVGKQISVLTPVLDAHLLSGDRVNATILPISMQGNTLTVRRFARSPWTIVHFISERSRTLSIEMAAFLWQAIHFEMNILVAGGTASGKTSMLNALTIFVQPFQRIISIEDTREISFSSVHWNWLPLITRLPNPEGLGEVTMLDLMINALRMRPDRIIVGEIRRTEEAKVLFEAMHTGHSVYSTIHADTGAQVIRRLIEPPIELPSSELDALDLVVVQYRDRRRNLRKTSEISELVSTSGAAPVINKSYLWRPRTDKFEFTKQPIKYIQNINLHTGMTEKEIYEDQKIKADILRWMDKHNYREIEQVGRVIKYYYADAPSLYSAVEKNLNPEKVC